MRSTQPDSERHHAGELEHLLARLVSNRNLTKDEARDLAEGACNELLSFTHEIRSELQHALINADEESRVYPYIAWLIQLIDERQAELLRPK